jgi:hypothetical protein
MNREARMEPCDSKTQVQELILGLSAPDAACRLAALRRIKNLQDQGRLAAVPRGRDVNNHIHTIYSFSPYSPAKAVWMASQAGLSTAGIMDHDSVCGAREFIEAGTIMRLPTTIGAECRASLRGTFLEGRKINNPDQDSNAYIALHGVPHNQIDALSEFFQPVRQARSQRSRLMTSRLNRLLQPAGINLDFDRDIVPLSAYADGGEITERHLLFAAAGKMLDRFGTGGSLAGFLEHSLGIPVNARAAGYLSDPDNAHRPYDLLNVLKSNLVERFYIKTDAECPPISTIADFASRHGIILAYPYLGDITESVTGDKKAQSFEDAYLDELFSFLWDTGFQAVTYMPSRNTRQQLLRLRELCAQHGFFQISGEDINQPRQTFVCEAMRDPLFANLYDAAWALIGHEKMAGEDLAQGLFSSNTAGKWPDLTNRISHFRDIALKLHQENPDHV